MGTYVLISLRSVPGGGGGIAGSDRGSVFRVLRSCRTALQSGCATSPFPAAPSACPRASVPSPAPSSVCCSHARGRDVGSLCSSVTAHVQQLSWAYWLFAHFLQTNVCSDLFPVFVWILCLFIAYSFKPNRLTLLGLGFIIKWESGI